MRKNRLRQQLSRLQGFENPKVKLEQYLTPPQLAADMVHMAYMQGDIEGKAVADLGTGAGILAIGAALAGGEVTAVDSDPEALAIARENAEELGVAESISFVEMDVKDFSGSYDTVVMNPPFSVHSDTGLVFIEKAVSVADTVYTLANRSARTRIKNFLGNSRHEIRAVEEYSIALPPAFGFHTREGRETDIDLVITGRDNNGAQDS